MSTYFTKENYATADQGLSVSTFMQYFYCSEDDDDYRLGREIIARQVAVLSYKKVPEFIGSMVSQWHSPKYAVTRHKPVEIREQELNEVIGRYKQLRATLNSFIELPKQQLPVKHALLREGYLYAYYHNEWYEFSIDATGKLQPSDNPELVNQQLITADDYLLAIKPSTSSVVKIAFSETQWSVRYRDELAAKHFAKGNQRLQQLRIIDVVNLNKTNKPSQHLGLAEHLTQHLPDWDAADTQQSQLIGHNNKDDNTFAATLTLHDPLGQLNQLAQITNGALEALQLLELDSRTPKDGDDPEEFLETYQLADTVYQLAESDFKLSRHIDYTKVNEILKLDLKRAYQARVVCWSETLLNYLTANQTDFMQADTGLAVATMLQDYRHKTDEDYLVGAMTLAANLQLAQHCDKAGKVLQKTFSSQQDNLLRPWLTVNDAQLDVLKANKLEVAGHLLMAVAGFTVNKPESEKITFEYANQCCKHFIGQTLEKEEMTVKAVQDALVIAANYDDETARNKKLDELSQKNKQATQQEIAGQVENLEALVSAVSEKLKAGKASTPLIQLNQAILNDNKLASLKTVIVKLSNTVSDNLARLAGSTALTHPLAKSGGLFFLLALEFSNVIRASHTAQQAGLREREPELSWQYRRSGFTIAGLGLQVGAHFVKRQMEKAVKDKLREKLENKLAGTVLGGGAFLYLANAIAVGSSGYHIWRLTRRGDYKGAAFMSVDFAGNWLAGAAIVGGTLNAMPANAALTRMAQGLIARYSQVRLGQAVLLLLGVGLSTASAIVVGIGSLVLVMLSAFLQLRWGYTPLEEWCRYGMFGIDRGKDKELLARYSSAKAAHQALLTTLFTPIIAWQYSPSNATGKQLHLTIQLPYAQRQTQVFCTVELFQMQVPDIGFMARRRRAKLPLSEQLKLDLFSGKFASDTLALMPEITSQDIEVKQIRQTQLYPLKLEAAQGRVQSTLKFDLDESMQAQALACRVKLVIDTDGEGEQLLPINQAEALPYYESTYLFDLYRTFVSERAWQQHKAVNPKLKPSDLLTQLYSKGQGVRIID